MKSIGIKLADGSFYPIMQEGSSDSITLDVTTVQDNQTTVQLDLYSSELGSMADAQYIDSLEIKDLNPHPYGEPSLKVDLHFDENNKLHAQVLDKETGKVSKKHVSLVSRSEEERSKPANFNIENAEPEEKAASSEGEEASSDSAKSASLDDDFDFTHRRFF